MGNIEISSENKIILRTICSCCKWGNDDVTEIKQARLEHSHFDIYDQQTKSRILKRIGSETLRLHRFGF